ncbi:MAG: tetratricopeptide repeat protein [bacterium]
MSSPTPPQPRRRASLRLLGLLVLLFAANAKAQDVAYVGEPVCAGCHAAEAALWKGSHHDLAMQEATPRTVLGRFDGARFTKDGVTTTFSQRDGRFSVRTDGPDGALHDYRVAYTFGVAPLQQYLLELPQGRLQALGIAWDSRPAAAGGQRWFDLYPGEHIDRRDVLHWSGPMQNWNFMCAECHSTDLRKGYQAAEDRFDTTWAALNVSCEACHGPGARHVQWAADAKAGRTPAAADSRRGFAIELAERGTWQVAPGASIAHRTDAAPAGAQIDTCGRCHSRHAQLAEGEPAAAPLTDARQLALLDAGRFHADGQILDEVYEYASFRQSRMFHAGVTCSNCHDPHSLQLRAPGNAVCAQCHVPAVFDGPQHTHHAAASAGAQCVACHMIERTYMQIDARRDHSLRVPRPDLSLTLGTPNACNDCHRDQSPQWAADRVAQWYGPRRRQTWHYGQSLQAGRTARPDAELQLIRAIQDASVPAIARATAVSLLAPYLGPRSLPALQAATRDSDPLVRRAAAETADALDTSARLATAAPLLDDPILTVRLAAFTTLLEVPSNALSPAQAAAMARVAEQYRAVQRFNADRAESWSNLGILAMHDGEAAAARSDFDTAIRLQPSFVPAYVNLADLERGQGDEAAAEATLRRALVANPDAAALHHALALSLVRQQRRDEAVAALRRAVELAPDESRYAYVLAVALHDTGDAPGALAVLRRATAARPAERDVLMALLQYSAEAGDDAGALAAARMLRQVSGDPRADQLVAQFEARGAATPSPR